MNVFNSIVSVFNGSKISLILFISDSRVFLFIFLMTFPNVEAGIDPIVKVNAY